MKKKPIPTNEDTEKYFEQLDKKLANGNLTNEKKGGKLKHGKNTD